MTTRQTNFSHALKITAAEKTFCAAIIMAVLAYYWSVFFYFALNAGQADDFVDVLWFIEIFLSRTQWQEWFAVIALPNHEHITVINHLLYLLDYALFKEINFFHYMLLGNVILLACCWVLADWLKAIVGWWYAAAIAVGFFFNLYYWNASFWAMTAISNQIVILFALLAARCLARNRDAITMPLCWSLLAILSQFNGLLVLPALISASWLAAYSNGIPQNYRQLAAWLLAFFVSAVLYFWYENPFAADHLWRYVLYTDPANLQEYIKPSYGKPVTALGEITQAVLSWFVVIGATVFDLKLWIPAAIFGGVMLCIFLRNGRSTAVRTDIFFIAILLFILVSLALVAIGRGRAFGEVAGLTYRYRLYSSLLLVLLCGSCLQVYSWRYLRVVLLAACAVFQGLSWLVLDDIAEERNNIKVSHYNWLIDGGMGRSQMPFYPHNQDLRLFNAYYSGYYNPYEAIDARYKPAHLESAATSDCERSSNKTAQTQVQAYSKKARALAVELRLSVPVSDSAEFLFCGAQAYSLSLSAKNIDQQTKQYWPIVVLKKQLPPSQYRVLWWNNTDNQYEEIGGIRFP